MAEGTGTGEGKQSEDGGKKNDDGGFTPPASQEELNQIIEKRIQRERSKFGDYEDLKAKAAKLDTIEAANKSDLEKANDAKTAAEHAAEQAKSEALRWKVAAKHGISDEDAELFLTGTDEQTLTKQAERLADRKPPGRNHVRREGSTTKPEEDEMREFTRNLFGAQTS